MSLGLERNAAIFPLVWPFCYRAKQPGTTAKSRRSRGEMAGFAPRPRAAIRLTWSVELTKHPPSRMLVI